MDVHGSTWNLNSPRRSETRAASDGAVLLRIDATTLPGYWAEIDTAGMSHTSSSSRAGQCPYTTLTPMIRSRLSSSSRDSGTLVWRLWRLALSVEQGEVGHKS